jgi:hypothetical protein
MELDVLLVIWAAMGLVLILLTCRRRVDVAGLALAYFCGLSLIHVPGAFLYVDPTFATSGLFGEWTRRGFEITVVGAVFFVVGVSVAHAAHKGFTRGNGPSSRYLDWLVWRRSLLYMLVGGVSYFVLLPITSDLPGTAAVVSSVASFLIVGLCLRLWGAMRRSLTGTFWATIAMLPCLPFSTLLAGGFLSFGTAWLIAVAAFLVSVKKRPALVVVLSPVAAYLALSVFVTYMASRNEIRATIWYDRASVGARLERLVASFSEFQLVDFGNDAQRYVLDSRLNQNWLVGAAAMRIDGGDVELAMGDTLGEMVLALIPRVIWPDKPSVAGGNKVVTQYTGITFNNWTSVGLGQVMELYINFGIFGVCVGHFILGFLLGVLDLRSGTALWAADEWAFVSNYIVGLALIAPGGNLKETIVAAVASVVVARLSSKYLFRRVGPGRLETCLTRTLSPDALAQLSSRRRLQRVRRWS